MPFGLDPLSRWPLYLVTMPSDIKYPTHWVNGKMCNLWWTPNSEINHFLVSHTIAFLECPADNSKCRACYRHGHWEAACLRRPLGTRRPPSLFEKLESECIKLASLITPYSVLIYCAKEKHCKISSRKDLQTER